MPFVLTKSSVIGCGHSPGAVDLSAVASKLIVAGQPAVLAGGIALIKGCPIVPSPGSAPCGPVTLVPGTGVSTKLKVGGRPVMLDSVKASTTGAPPPGVFAVTVVQTKLSAV